MIKLSVHPLSKVRGKRMKTSHSLRVRIKTWEAIEKKAWSLSSKAGRIIKPTDIADGILFKGIKDIKIEDIQMAMDARAKDE